MEALESRLIALRVGRIPLSRMLAEEPSAIFAESLVIRSEHEVERLRGSPCHRTRAV